MTDDRPRAVLVLPGRGAYTAATLGTIPVDHPLVAEAESLRAEMGLDSLLALDSADRFAPEIHLRPANASPLIFLASMLDAERAAADHRLVAVIGNSLGWYTALTVAGALDFADGFRLVQGIALLQEEAAAAGVDGGQLIYPRVGVDWQPVEEYGAAVEAALTDGAGSDDGRRSRTAPTRASTSAVTWCWPRLKQASPACSTCCHRSSSASASSRSASPTTARTTPPCWPMWPARPARASRPWTGGRRP